MIKDNSEKQKFLEANFLLQSDIAVSLYHEYAKDLPIIDYHNHLSPKEIYENKNFVNITHAWLNGDHYKWRAMRANGISEDYITGDATDKQKFLKWAETVPHTMRNPLYHWTHLELQRYFGITNLLRPSTADEIYNNSSALLQEESYSPKGLLKKMNVELVCTTDHPTDSLFYHKENLNEDDQLKLLPTFRPDKFLNITHSDFLIYLHKLESIIDSEINSFDKLLEALSSRIDFFDALGCRLSDHGLSQLFIENKNQISLDKILLKRKSLELVDEEEAQNFQMVLLYELGKLYHSKSWSMQLHLGAIRNNNSRLMRSIGADVGADSIGDYDQARGLSFFLDKLDNENKLSKTILYNLNPRDNEVFATMAGNFNDGSMAGKIQWGSAWWFLDQKDGMEKQINTLSNMGLLSRFLGMLTDSRSFLSFTRHEYFRRILCNIIGQDVSDGLLPDDVAWLGQMVQNICYNNAKDYFDFDNDQTSNV